MDSHISDPVRVAPYGYFDAMRGQRGWFFGLGALLVILGIVAILVPLVATLATVLFLGWLFILGAIAEAVHAYQHRAQGGVGWMILSAILLAVAGVLILIDPIVGTLMLTLVLAAFFLVEGAVKILRALQHRSMPRWGFLLFDGIVSVVLGILIGVGWPGTAVWALGLLVGVDLIMSGWGLLLLGATVGVAEPAPRVGV
jgi:uncharacterized membrane protein HdeD (DUF308 family)